MHLHNSRQCQRTARFSFKALFIVFLAVAVVGCGEMETGDSQPDSGQDETFTFFDLGSNSVLSNGTRKELQDKLGRDAFADRSIIDLTINYRGFLKEYFPDLHQLNQRLNDPPGERIEHQTKKLMYRYAQKKGSPFDYVELIFSGYTSVPLLFDIRFRKDDTNVVKTLETKYGRPDTISWKNESGKSVYWTKGGDYLIVSFIPDQFGQNRYQIVIFFTENLKRLIEIEQNRKGLKKQQRLKAGEKAF
jgi:hypothetical protein